MGESLSPAAGEREGGSLGGKWERGPQSEKKKKWERLQAAREWDV